MDKAAANRIDRCVRTLHSRLGPKFYLNRYPDQPAIAFGFAEKAGTVFPDGKKWKDHGGITFKQLEIIESTSQSDEELMERIRKLILDKIDTTRSAQDAPKLSMSDIEAIASKRVEELLATRLEAMLSSRAKADALKAQAVADVVVRAESGMVEDQPKRGLQLRKKGMIAKNKAKFTAETQQVWLERAATLQIKPVYKLDGVHLDGRWIRTMTKLWAEHVSKHEHAAQVPTEQPTA